MITVKSNVLDSFLDMEKEIQKTIAAAAMNLYNELEAKTPVDTSNLKQSWQEVRQLDKYTWILANEADYAEVIFAGRRQVGNKMVGSLQLPDGIAPILIKHEERLLDKLEGIKR